MQNQLLERTRLHYDEFHFIEGGSNRIQWWREYLRDFLPDEDIRDRLILDDGSSVGEISRGLIDRRGRLVCLDISLQSLRRCCELNPEAEIFHGNALDLPFPNNTFNHAISIGVLHHTPDCRRGFAEVARVTAQGGTIVIFLYNFWNIYNLIYHAFKPVRAAIPLDRIPSRTLGILQPFVQSHLHQVLNREELRNLLGDKLWTPQATFHTVSQVRRWGTEEGLRLVAVKRFYLGYANVMRFEKQGTPDGSARRQVLIKCLNCGSSPMRKDEEGYRCSHCGNVYGFDGGITRCVVS